MIEVMSEQPIPQDRAVESYTVLGAGVIGLLTASELASQGHQVTVISREGQPSQAASSTSANAVGQFLPWVPEEHAKALLGDVDLETVTEFSRSFYEHLAANPHETGVMPVHNVELVQSDTPWPKGLPEAMRASTATLETEVPFTDPDGELIECDEVIQFDTFSINAGKTIPYLADEAARKGVTFVSKHLTKAEIAGLEGVVINATGIGAHEIDSSQTVSHFKGHTFVIKPQQGVSVPRSALSVEDLIMMPREDGTIVCGALYIENPQRPVPEEEEAKALFERLGKLFKDAAAAGIVEGLDPDLLDKSEVLLHSAGYRVEVEGGGIRVAPDAENERLLHAYGFGGVGWSVGPHFAKKIAKMAQEMHSKSKGE